MRMKQRIEALEAKGGKGLPHVVVWAAGQSFDEALASSQKLEGADSRLLIERSIVDGPELTPEQLAERAKAHAWADELEAA